MPSQQAPTPPNAGQDYNAGLQTFMRNLPGMLQKEYGFRQQYDPKFTQQQQDLQSQFGTKQYQQQLDALNQLNPYFSKVYGALGNSVLGGLDPNNPYTASANKLALQTGNEAALGTKLDPAYAQQLQTQIRGAQAARGNVMGNAGISGEALYQGRAGQDLYSQRLARAGQAGQFAAQQRQLPISNAGLYLGTSSPIQQIQGIQPVSAPDQFRIVNPNAGYLGQQIGQQGYQNQLAAYSGGQGSGAGWGSLAGGIVGGTIGGIYGGPAGGQLGAAGGSATGGAVGGYFSDRRIKENIVDTGERTRDGIPRVIFNYIGLPKRYKGLLAQDVLIKRPDAVWQNRGILGVFYDMLGEKMEAV